MSEQTKSIKAIKSSDSQEPHTSIADMDAGSTFRVETPSKESQTSDTGATMGTSIRPLDPRLIKPEFLVEAELIIEAELIDEAELTDATELIDEAKLKPLLDIIPGRNQLIKAKITGSLIEDRITQENLIVLVNRQQENINVLTVDNKSLRYELDEARKREIMLEKKYKEEYARIVQDNEQAISKHTETINNLKEELARLTSEIRELREARKRKITYPQSWLQDIVDSFKKEEEMENQDE